MTEISATSALMATAAKPAAGNDERAALAKAAKAFEAIFTRQMMSNMRKGSLGEDIAGSSAVDQFRELSDAKMAESLSTKGSLGIADLILKQLDRTK